MPGAWETPERLLGELQPERLYQELGSQLELLCSQLSKAGAAERPQSAPVYGIYDFLRGNLGPSVDDTVN